MSVRFLMQSIHFNSYLSVHEIKMVIITVDITKLPTLIIVEQ